jgi:hypothetical protein
MGPIGFSLALADALVALESAAAVVESYLPAELTPAQQRELWSCWGPVPPEKGISYRQRQIRAEEWVAWLRSCAGRYEQRPVEPSADELHQVIVSWACASHQGRH